MISKIFVLVFTLCFCLYHVSGASYSKVYVQGGQEVIPVKYVQYGAPAISISSPKIARITATPVESVVPVASTPDVITPCGAPCIYRGPKISSVAQIPSPTPNFVTYKSNVPVGVANSEEPNGYEYGYTVYDGDTGDHKAQHETSDGSVVQGQYSLIQPDGYVREVHYTADDLRGFNAIVKKFLPVKVEAKHEDTEKDSAPPCHEIKQESLKSSGHKDKLENVHQEVSNIGSPENTSHAENNEALEEHHHYSPKDSNVKMTEALTQASSESTEGKGLLEQGEEHDHIHIHVVHDSEPHQEIEAQVHETHEIQPETSRATSHEAEKNPSYHDIIKCVQNAINSKDQIPAPLTYIILNNPC